jgi:hypothetical protein
MDHAAHIATIASDTPSDKPCWEANERLWRMFCDLYKAKTGWRPGYRDVFTEAYCTQWLDVDA